MSKTLRWLLASSLLWVLAATPAIARQDPDPTADLDEYLDEPLSEDEADSAIEAEGAEGGLAQGPSGLDDIEDILEADEDIFAGGGYTYDPGDRRDPFRSLKQRNALELPRGPRPEGKPGLLIEEISLTGIISTPEGILAQVRGGQKDKSYLLREGDQLYDGDVVSISLNEVVFKQIINDPAAIKPFREVVKRLDTNK